MKYSEVDKERVQQKPRGQHLKKRKKSSKGLKKGRRSELQKLPIFEKIEAGTKGVIDIWSEVYRPSFNLSSNSRKFEFDILFKVEQLL